MKIALVVLGMHRSGTSSVSGALIHLGGTAPKTLMPPADQNPRGFFESLPVTQLNDTLMSELGFSWDDWRPRTTKPSPNVDQRIVEMIRAEFNGANCIVLKDPRLCRLFPEWREALTASGYSPHIVMPIRKPAEVAASLCYRDSFSRSFSLRLWLRNVLDAESASRGLPRQVMNWSNFIEDWRSQIAIMDERLGTRLAPEEGKSGSAIDSFLSPDLYRQRSDDPCPTLISEAWETLTALVVAGDQPETLSRLDCIREGFDRAAELFDDAD